MMRIDSKTLGNRRDDLTTVLSHSRLLDEFFLELRALFGRGHIHVIYDKCVVLVSCYHHPTKAFESACCHHPTT